MTSLNKENLVPDHCAHSQLAGSGDQGICIDFCGSAGTDRMANLWRHVIGQMAIMAVPARRARWR